MWRGKVFGIYRLGGVRTDASLDSVINFGTVQTEKLSMKLTCHHFHFNLNRKGNIKPASDAKPIT